MIPPAVMKMIVIGIGVLVVGIVLMALVSAVTKGSRMRNIADSTLGMSSTVTSSGGPQTQQSAAMQKISSGTASRQDMRRYRRAMRTLDKIS